MAVINSEISEEDIETPTLYGDVLTVNAACEWDNAEDCNRNQSVSMLIPGHDLTDEFFLNEDGTLTLHRLLIRAGNVPEELIDSSNIIYERCVSSNYVGA